jgi:hypothetical protein
MGLFDKLMEEKHSQAENLAIAEMFGRISPNMRQWARERLSESKLHPSIVTALNKTDTGEEE